MRAEPLLISFSRPEISNSNHVNELIHLTSDVSETFFFYKNFFISFHLNIYAFSLSFTLFSSLFSSFSSLDLPFSCL